ncbi:hypothetical protein CAUPRSCDRAFT_11943 [Caulochytrium protostelioides]|uniref:Uncharacterized protein n=1 Tax=Caulochytrium protostelioides TaxID=1555241 RepID=A0A4P9WYJ4_9FUNG|nr:hypothetical protein CAUPRSCDRAFT_11943 [Caulochytrium protostelioides]
MHTPPQPTSSAHVDELDVYAEYCAADEAVLRPGLVKLMGLAAAASTRLGDESPTTVAAFTTPQDDAEKGPDDGLAATASSPSSISPSARVKLDPNEDGDDASPIRSAVDDDGDDDHPEAHDDRERPFASPVSDVDMTLDSESDAYPTAATHVVPFPSLPRNLNDLLATRTLDRHSRSMAEPEEVDASAAIAAAARPHGVRGDRRAVHGRTDDRAGDPPGSHADGGASVGVAHRAHDARGRGNAGVVSSLGGLHSGHCVGDPDAEQEPVPPRADGAYGAAQARAGAADGLAGHARARRGLSRRVPGAAVTPPRGAARAAARGVRVGAGAGRCGRGPPDVRVGLARPGCL